MPQIYTLYVYIIIFTLFRIAFEKNDLSITGLIEYTQLEYPFQLIKCTYRTLGGQFFSRFIQNQEDTLPR